MTEPLRRFQILEQALKRARRENRVKDECLEIALTILRHYASLTVHAAQETIDDIERRLAELEPEEEME